MAELPWDSLFMAPGAPENSSLRRGTVVRKQGRPLLFLPARPCAAASTLSLYSAQTAKARFARGLLRAFLRLGLPFGIEPGQLRLSKADPFLAFLGRCGNTSGIPEFGILAGNPSTPGTRFVIIVFGQSGSPEMVIKAGTTDLARELVRCEQHFLMGTCGRFPGIPTARDSFDSTRVQAFATQYVQGDSPPGKGVEEPAPVLGAWLQADRKTTLGELPAWRRLIVAAPEFAAPDPAALPFSPAVFHGDFAPWNIRVTDSGGWTVLDWERGELEGVPCWDWFHYVLQPAILVKRLAVSHLLEVSNHLLRSDAFCHYAVRAGATGHERKLLKAYLAYCVHVLRPSEGLARTRELLTTLAV